MKEFAKHIRIYIFRGLIAIIPLLLCALAVRLLYVLIDKKIITLLDKVVKIRHIPGLGILLVLVSLYFIGLIVSNLVGRRVLRIIETISQKIPILKTIYSAGKQISQSLSAVGDERQAFKKAVLVKLDDRGVFVPGFVMSKMTERNTGEEMLTVLIPTSPTPQSGFVLVVRASQVIDPGWTVEECLKASISMGIITPKQVGVPVK